MLPEEKIRVFISYSWDSKEHQKWVLSLADTIDSNGGKAIVDRTHLKYGGHIRTFMVKSILEADIVLMILTPKYKAKADNLKGGVGYEYNIINGNLFKIITKNDKYIPVIRTGNIKTSVTSFLRDFNCVDLSDTPDYENNLRDLLKQILKTKPKLIMNKKENKPISEKQYKNINSLIKEMNDNASEYFQKLFVTENVKMAKLKLSTELQSWEKEIEKYHSATVAKFNPKKMKLYQAYPEDFKNNVLGKELWTVKAALKTYDPDLARYKKDYREANSREIYNTVNGILDSTHEYVKNETPLINYKTLKEKEDLRMDYLDEEDMFMNKIIGFGIRSEILHRYFPAYFPIMTQQSLWAIYFICDSADEFITLEQQNRNERIRVSHNWQYPYDRFTFLMNSLVNSLGKWLGEYGLRIKPEYRFGYINIFLSEIHKLHKVDIKMLHAWEPIERD